MDYLVRATAAHGQIRAFAATTKDMVEYARAAHDTSPVATAALGRTLTGGVMMGSMMKSSTDLLTLQIKGDGPLGGIVVTADANGHAKGYVYHPHVLLPANAKGKLDVAGAVGKGTLQVIRDLGLKEPYQGSCELVSSEIAEDLTYYFVISEQVPSSVGLGVLMDKDNTVRQAGGFILQLMPYTPDEVITRLEEKLANVQSVTGLLDKGMTPEAILTLLLGDMDLKINDRMDVTYHCDCSKERVAKALISIGRRDLWEMIHDGKPIETSCHFCNKKYVFTVEELQKLYEQAKPITHSVAERIQKRKENAQ